MLHRAVLIMYISIFFLCLLGAHQGYRGKVSFGRTSMSRYIFILLFGILLNFVLLGNLLHHSQYMPGEQKGALYGAVGGASFGGIFLSVAILSSLLGMAIRTVRFEGKAPAEPSPQTDEVYPGWFMKIAHNLLAVMVGATIGTVALMAITDISLEKGMVILFGFAIGASSIYIPMVVGHYAGKSIKKK